jgi:hypothetical protein
VEHAQSAPAVHEVGLKGDRLLKLAARHLDVAACGGSQAGVVRGRSGGLHEGAHARVAKDRARGLRYEGSIADAAVAMVACLSRAVR